MIYSFSTLLLCTLTSLSGAFAQGFDFDDDLVNTLITPNDGFLSNALEQAGVVSQSPSVSPSPSVSASVSATPSPSMSSMPSLSPSPSPSAFPSMEVPSLSPSPSPEPRRGTGPTKSPPSPTPSPTPSLKRVTRRKRSDCLHEAYWQCGIKALADYPDPREPKKSCDVCRTKGPSLAMKQPIKTIESMQGLRRLVIEPILECVDGAKTIVRIFCDSPISRTRCHEAGGGYELQFMITSSEISVSRRLAAEMFLAIKARSEKRFRRGRCNNGFRCLRSTIRRNLVDWDQFVMDYADSLCGQASLQVEWQQLTPNPYVPMMVS